MSPCVVIDANRIFSELIAANHQLRRALTNLPNTRFICPKYVFVEIFKHKERIADASGLSEPALLSLLHSILERIEFIDEDSVRLGSWTEAWRLCRDVDENDTAYVALALDQDAELWTGDRVLEAGLRKKGFTRFFAPPQ
ncbi:PIN domain-containing protein [Prosthecobacter sp.]|jgi:predicted nucleic acid-binding protein|uniref:PIN domain-containing protein n=1 Tax=Prosthecobacter sp. TaxID=1965333 RepID=UPI0037848B9C